jgi:1,4-dihydroxy-2-naphthoate polyprenyltransferase
VATGLLTPRQVWTGTAVALGLAAAGGAYLAWVAGWVIIAIGVAAIGATLAYTAGPWPFGYHGLGEVFVFGFFGIAAVVGSRYVHDSTAPLEAWLLAVPVGLLAAAILVANNVRDIDTDRVAGKRTLAVIIGRSATRVLFAVLVVGSLACIAVFGGLGVTPRPTLIALVASPLAVAPVRTVLREQAGPPLITALRATALLHLAVGVLLALGAAT